MGGTQVPDLVERGHKPSGLKKSARCMGVNATLSVLNWALRHLHGIDCVVDPFCGAGTVLAVGNALGLHAVGVDISPLRVKQAKALDSKALLAGRSASGPCRPADDSDADGTSPRKSSA